MLVQPLRHRFQLMADLVHGEKIEYTGLGRCVLGALSAPAVAGLWNQWHETKVNLKPPGFARESYDSSNKIKCLLFTDGN
jgi:hypothetical protein